MRSKFVRLIIGAAALAVSVNALAISLNATTGDLGNNVINDSGDFLWQPILNTPSGLGPDTLTVKYGLWNSPAVLIEALVNGSSVGNFLADTGFISPGPAFFVVDVAGLLVDGINNILFTGHSANVGDYVIGQVDLAYDSRSVSMSEPGALWLLAMGFAMLVWVRRRKPA